MTRDSLSADDVAVSEMTGIVILVAITVVITISVGLNAVVVDEAAGGPPQANFSYTYIRDSSILLVEHARGEQIAAGNLTIRGPNGANATWAELANSNESELVGPGDLVQLSNNNAYGDSVPASGDVSVYYTPPTGNETKLSEWKGR